MNPGSSTKSVILRRGLATQRRAPVGLPPIRRWRPRPKLQVHGFNSLDAIVHAAAAQRIGHAKVLRRDLSISAARSSK